MTNNLRSLIIGVFLVLIAGVGTAFASDGTFELRSTTQYDYRCFAASLLMQNANYKIIVSCRNILYPVPIEGANYSYVLWANPIDGGNPIKLGGIGLGKGEYATKKAFASLFITTEKNAKANAPAGEVVMRGSVKPITFLEKPTSDTTQQTDNNTQEGENKTESPTPEPTKTSVRDRLIVGLKRAGLASGLALVAILGLVFILTRPK